MTKEIALLARANAALRDGDAGAALALLDQHDRRFPGSGLAEEVAATRIIARCQLAPGATAAAARAFVARHPSSPLGPRVARACGPQGQRDDDR